MIRIRFLPMALLFLLICFQQAGAISPERKYIVFPLPLEMKINPGYFIIDEKTLIILPEKSSPSDNFIADQLSAAFPDEYEIPVKKLIVSAFPANARYILIGDVSNPLVKKYCTDNKLLSRLKGLGDEGYILNVTENTAVVAANTKRGALFGLESLRQLAEKSESKVRITQAVIADAPAAPFRGIKLYLPGKENITFFKRFIKDFVALYKFNTIILELNANMRLEKHPELNVGAVQFERHLRFSRLDRPPGKHMEFQNSSHQDNADGQILEKHEVADLVNYMRQFNIEVIPELPSLTHSYYLLSGHEELAENPDQPYPDTYCPLKPEIYDIYFDVLDEYIDAIHPSMIHAGHDEWRMEKDLCELCRGKDYGELYAMDIVKIHGYLEKKGIRMAIWGDHLLESVTGKEFRTWKSSAGYEYKIPGALSPEQVSKLIPKDILIFNWFWDKIDNDRQVSEFGFEQVYGNFRPDIKEWNSRKEIRGVLGGAPSSWAATTELNIGKDQMMAFLGTAGLLWSGEIMPPDSLPLIAEPLISGIRRRLSGIALPSEEGAKISSVDLTGYFQGTPIKVGKDVNSLIFLHACEKPARNDEAYRIIHNHAETAELLGWYEVIYEDGFVTTIPVRYGVNILDWKWKQRISPGAEAGPGQKKYAYLASTVDISDKDTTTFFSYEWVSMRPGKIIREIRLRTVDFNGKNENSIILKEISITENTKAETSEGTEER